MDWRQHVLGGAKVVSGVLGGSNGAGVEGGVLDFTAQGLLTTATAERVNDMARPPGNWRCDRDGIARIAPNRPSTARDFGCVVTPARKIGITEAP